MAERLFAIDAFAQLHGDHGGRRVVMVGGGDEDRVDLLADLVEHHAVIGEDLELVGIHLFILQPFFDFRVGFLVGIHDGDQVLLAGRTIHSR